MPIRKVFTYRVALSCKPHVVANLCTYIINYDLEKTAAALLSVGIDETRVFLPWDGTLAKVAYEGPVSFPPVGVCNVPV